MKVLVTGANGFLGSRTTAWLRRRGFQVRAFVRRPESLVGIAVDETAIGDITSAAAVSEAVSGVDAVVHCAAVPGPDLATSLRVNGEGTANLVEAALAAGGQRFILVSTQSVYDKRTTGDVYEEAPLCVDGTPYDLGKIAAEKAVRAGEQRGLQAVILRPPLILGAHRTSTWGYKIAKMLQEGRFPLVGDGAGKVAFIHVDNLARVIELALTRREAVGQTYNTVDGYTTWREFTDRFREWLALGPLPSIQADAAPVFAWQGWPNGERLMRELGYVPERSYEEALEETLALLRADGLVS